MDINQKLTEELGVKRWQIDAAVKLIDEGNTIPFISRYRKEATGSLNDEQLRKLHERLLYLRSLEEKKEQVLSSIEEQGKLTEELKAQILAAEALVTVEDLYRPYRPKRRTRATIAKEKGLEPLAALIWLQKTGEPLENAARLYISEEKGVATEADAIAGAQDIIAESISDNADYRTWIRRTTMKKGKVVSAAKDPDAESVYEMYYDFEEPVSKLAGHRILALNRGEKEKILTVKIEAPEEEIIAWLEKKTLRENNPFTSPVIKEAVKDSYHRLIAPAIEREIRNDLTEKAEDGAIQVFGKNLHQLLMQPPVAGRVVLGWDPAFRTGCKLAVVDETGKVIGTTVIYPTAPTTPKKIQASKDLLKKIIPKYHISLISLGNGTASRESEQFIVELLKEIPDLQGIAGITLIIFGSYFVLDTTKERFSFALIKNKSIQYRFLALIFCSAEAVFIKKLIELSNVTEAFILWCFAGALFSIILLALYKIKIKTELSKLKHINLLFLFIIVFCTGIMQLTTNYVFENMNVAYALSLFQLSSILSIILGYKIFKETNIMKKLLGAFIMLVGAVMIIVFK